MTSNKENHFQTTVKIYIWDYPYFDKSMVNPKYLDDEDVLPYVWKGFFII